MGKANPGADPRIAELRAAYKRIDAEFRQQLEDAGINPNGFYLEVGDPRIDKLEAADKWRRQALDELHTKCEFDSPPPLPFGWQGEHPQYDHGRYVDVRTLDGLKWLVDDGCQLFNARLHEGYPFDSDDGLEFARQTLCNAYRAAREQRLVKQIPTTVDLQGANDIENGWTELQHILHDREYGDDAKSKRPPVDPELTSSDGPRNPYTWCHNGKVIKDRMRPAPWRLVNFLWSSDDKTSHYDAIAEPVYEDANHVFDSQAVGSLRREANEFFDKHGVKWRVSIKGTIVFLKPHNPPA